MTGSDLLELGYQPGPAFGAVLESTYQAQIDGELRDAIHARDFARRRMQEQLDAPVM